MLTRALTVKAPLRILLVDDSPEFMESEARFLRAHPQFEIVGRAQSGREAIDQISRLNPDLVLMDVALPEMNGLEATRAIKSRADAPRVIILTLHDSPMYRTAAQDSKADGFVPKAEFGKQMLPLLAALFP